MRLVVAFLLGASAAVGLRLSLTHARPADDRRARSGCAWSAEREAVTRPGRRESASRPAHAASHAGERS